MRQREGFTLVELLVVIAIVIILAGILLPIYASAREKAQQTKCISGLKQMSTAIVMYEDDYDTLMPRWLRSATMALMMRGNRSGKEVVPEPGSLLALGSGLMALAGFAIQRTTGIITSFYGFYETPIDAREKVRYNACNAIGIVQARTQTCSISSALRTGPRRCPKPNLEMSSAPS